MGKVYTVFDGNNFVTKKYVDDKCPKIGITTYDWVLPSLAPGKTLSYSKRVNFSGDDVIGVIPFVSNKQLAVTPYFWHTSEGFYELVIYVVNISTETIEEGYGAGANIAFIPKTK